MTRQIYLIKISKALVIQTFILQIFILGFIFISVSHAQNNPRNIILKLGDAKVKINIYEKPGSLITFVALHHNEQTSINVAKKIIEKKGGRLIELESLDEKGAPSRRLKFELGQLFYSIDPNRIFTDNGRTCNYSLAIAPEIKAFAEKLLKLILTPTGKRLRKGERFLVSLHNNQNIDKETRDIGEKDLTAFAYIQGGKTQHPLLGQYSAQAAGVFISNVEPDEDNFVFLSAPAYLSFFAAKGFNVVVQKPASELKTSNCEIDDGSLSVFFGQQHISYMSLEADNKNGRDRQKQMIEAVYQLVKK